MRFEQSEKGNCEGVDRNFDHFPQLTVFSAKTILSSVKANASFPAFRPTSVPFKTSFNDKRLNFIAECCLGNSTEERECLGLLRYQ